MKQVIVNKLFLSYLNWHTCEVQRTWMESNRSG